MTYRQLGRFRVNLEYIQQHPEDVADMFSFIRFVPLDTTIHYDVYCIEYLGVCSLFTEVPEGSEAPLYDMEVGVVENKVSWVLMKKRKE